VKPVELRTLVTAATWLLALASFVLLVGCGAPVRVPEPMPDPFSAVASLTRDGVLVHSWTPVGQAAGAAWSGPRTRLYTYVLSGDAGGNDGDGGSSSRLRARQCLDGLLRETQASQRASSITEADLLQRANQFVLPARGYEKGAFRLEHYDFALAAGYLNRFQLALSKPEFAERLARLGPFLIASPLPLNELVKLAPDGRLVVDTSAPVLLVDMTESNPKAAPAYLNAFKDAVRTGLPEETTTLEPLRARFASVVLTTAEALPFVAEAYAGTRKLLAAPP
jgi:hypothetical protein